MALHLDFLTVTRCCMVKSFWVCLLAGWYFIDCREHAECEYYLRRWVWLVSLLFTQLHSSVLLIYWRIWIHGLLKTRMWAVSSPPLRSLLTNELCGISHQKQYEKYCWLFPQPTQTGNGPTLLQCSVGRDRKKRSIWSIWRYMPLCYCLEIVR